MKGSTFSKLYSLVDSIEPHGSLDRILRLFVTFAVLYWNAIEGAPFNTEYSSLFVRWYPIPIWRLLLLSAVVAGALWCPSVGIMLAYAFFFYSMDLEVTMDTWT